MSADLLVKDDIVFGNRIEVIALCSKVEVMQNVSSAGSYREIYHLSGKDGAFVSGIIFKNFGATKVDEELFTDCPVLVKGTIGEYRDAKQIHIESISPLKEVLDKDDLLAEMVDSRLIDEVNDILWSHESLFGISLAHLKPAIGLEEAGSGTYAVRLKKFLQAGLIIDAQLTAEYIDAISLLSNYYLNTENTLTSRLDLLKHLDTPLIRALLFGCGDCPEYEEFVKLHHLIMKPRGCALEILDTAYTIRFGDRSDI